MKVASLIQEPTKSTYQKIAFHFSKAAAQYELFSQLQQEIGLRLIEKLPKANTILDIGCGTAFLTSTLKKKNPEALLIALDISEEMLQQAATKNKASLLCANMENLPLESHSFELVFSNMSLQWSLNLSHNLYEIHRVLKPGGSCLFSIPGPLSLIELKRSWQQVDQHTHVNDFCSQLLFQQALLAAGFKKFKLETKHYTLEYASVLELMKHLKTTGADCVIHQSAVLTGKHKFSKMVEAYEHYRQENGLIPCSYEIIFVEAEA